LEPSFRFYLLYDKIYRPDILSYAYDLARENAGAPGVDGMTFERIEASGLEEWLRDLHVELVEKTYRPSPVKRVMIPKPGGGERPLGIPTIRDRVVQTAAKLVLEPIFEADFEDSAYGYRPRRSAVDAVKEVHKLLIEGYIDVVDADLSKYFDTIPHAQLLRSVARRVVDRNVLGLVKAWLRVPAEERTSEGQRRMVGGKGQKRGTPQGGVISPLLANIYMMRYLKYWRLSACGKAFRAYVVNYADDFVIVSWKSAASALNWTRDVMTKIGLCLNETKTSLKNAREESFDFLGYTLGPSYFWRNGHRYTAASPSKKSVQRIKRKISDLLKPSNTAPWPEVQARLDSLLKGWQAYFNYGSLAKVYRAVDHHVYDRVRNFLCKRHKVPGRGTTRFTHDYVYGELGVHRLNCVRRMTPTCASR
jgi:RNA-directed DNA polymerase